MATLADVRHADSLEPELEAHRRALTGYCYRMLGSWFEAEDAVQETMVRAWRSFERLQAPGALKSWLYKIATNVCLDMLQGAQRRARPMDVADLGSADGPLPAPLGDELWLQPIPVDPADAADSKESLRLAFVAALQHLPPRQRAVLVLRDVLRWRASEVAELLDTTTVSVNSALQRARATLDALDLEADHAIDLDADHSALLSRYVDAFERYDMDALVALLQEDATMCMPPHPLWLRGADEVVAWMTGKGAGCRGSRLVPTAANGLPAAAIYKPAGAGVWKPFNIVVLEPAGGRIAGIHHFLDTRLFAAFGLPSELTAA